MQQTLIHHPKLTVRVRTGSEGPSCDPYSFTETTVETPFGKLVVHEGLLVWVEVSGKRFDNLRDDHTTQAWIRQLWQTIAGYSKVQIERIHRKLMSQCRSCGGKDFQHQSGYPGETFLICSACGHVQDSYFNLSAVE